MASDVLMIAAALLFALLLLRVQLRLRAVEQLLEDIAAILDTEDDR